MKITELYGIVRLNITNWEAGLLKMKAGTQDLRRNVAQLASDVNSAATRIVASVGAMATGVAAVTTKMGFSFLQSRDSAEIMLGTILKNAPLAKKTLDELFVAAKKTPFSFEGLKDGMVQLANAKVPAQQLIPWLYKISDAVAAVGGSDADIKGVTYALSQMMTAGRLNAQDMMQLTNRGIAGWDMLAQKLGATVAEVRKASEAGAIDGRMAADLIVQAMGERFAGAGDQLSAKFQGLWSSFLDQARMNAGRIIEPLYDAVGRVLSRLNQSVDSGGATGWIDRLRNMVAGVADALEQLVTTQGPQILDGIVSGFEALGRVGTSVIGYLREQGPALMEAASGWGEFIGQIVEFLTLHPELVTALVFLKGGEILGINQVILTLITTFASLLSTVGALTLALPALGIAFGVLAGTYLAQADKDIKAFNEELEKTKRLTDEMSARRTGANSEKLQQIRSWAATPDKAGAEAYLRQQLELAKREMAGAQASVKGAQSAYDAEAAKTTLLDTLGGDKMVAAAQQELTETKQRAAEAKNFVMALEQELQKLLSQKGAAAPMAGGGGAQAQAAAAAPANMNLAEILAQKTAEKQEQLEEKKAEKDAERDEKTAEREGEQRAREADNTLYDFGQRLFELQSHIPNEQIELFNTYLQDLTTKYREGSITQDEYRHSIDLVNDSIQAATQAADAKANFDKQIADMQQRLAAEGISNPVFEQRAEGLRQQMTALAQRFQSGEINAFEFRKETEKLTNAMEAAAAAAREEERAKERQLKMRLLSGQGTQEDFQKLFAMQQAQAMQNFDQALNSTFNAMFGLGEASMQLQTQFTNINNGLQTFGDNLSSIGSQAPSVQEAAQGISQMLNSQAGQASILFNNIQMLRQALSVVDTYPQQQRILRQIAELEQQYVAMTRPRAPLFTGSSLEVTGPGGVGTQNNKFELSFPNWSPQSGLDIQLLAEQIAVEIERRGRRN